MAIVGRGRCGSWRIVKTGRARCVLLPTGLRSIGCPVATDVVGAEDLTEPFVLHDGRLTVPTGPGSGVTVRADLVREWALAAPVLLRG